MTSNEVQSIPRTMSPTLTLQLGAVIRVGIHVAILGGKLAHRTQAQQTWKDYSQLLTVAKRLYVLIVSYEERFFLKTNTSTMVVLFKDY